MVLVAVSLLAPVKLKSQDAAREKTVFVIAAAPATNPATTSSKAVPGVPIPPERRKAGFLAGAGLAILSLLALAAGLALVRAFKR